MIAVDSTGEAVVHSNAYPLPLRKPSQVGAWVRMLTLLGMTLCALFYIIGAHAQADAAQIQQVEQTCTAKADDVDTAMFNPCATLDATQVRDQRGAYVPGGPSLPCDTWTCHIIRVDIQQQ